MRAVINTGAMGERLRGRVCPVVGEIKVDGMKLYELDVTTVRSRGRRVYPFSAGEVKLLEAINSGRAV